MARNTPASHPRPGAVTPPSRPRSGLLLALAVLLALSLAGNALLLARTKKIPSPTAAPPVQPVAKWAVEPPVAPVGAPTAATVPTLPVPSEHRAYAGLGTYVAATNRIPDLEWTEAQFAAFVEGLRACYAGRPYPFDEAARDLREAINQQVQAMQGAPAADPIEDYFATLRETEGVQRTDSNLHYRMTIEGEGEAPAVGDQVVVSYAARLPGGETVPSLARERVRVRVGDLLPGLNEGLQRMRAGGKALLYLPPPLSFGTGQWPTDVPPGSPVVFFIELHEVIHDDW